MKASEIQVSCDEVGPSVPLEQAVEYRWDGEPHLRHQHRERRGYQGARTQDVHPGRCVPCAPGNFGFSHDMPPRMQEYDM